MTNMNYYVALPFVAAGDIPAPAEVVECHSTNVAVMRAGGLSRAEGYIGAIAFSRTGVPAIGELGYAQLVRKFGDVPDI